MGFHQHQRAVVQRGHWRTLAWHAQGLRLSGGSGYDLFHFAKGEAGGDSIIDFTGNAGAAGMMDAHKH